MSVKEKYGKMKEKFKYLKEKIWITIELLILKIWRLWIAR